MAGQIVVNGRVEHKSGRAVEQADTVQVVQSLPYVSRGGVKLAHALEAFHIEPGDWSVIDIGASTGGFTDCWLQFGAGRVYAVDVGYGQLDWRLRQDSRVVVMERTNARYLTADQLGGLAADGASVDASFIGLRLLLEPLHALLKSTGVVVALVKPQFEAGRRQVGKGGVVRKPEVHLGVLRDVIAQAHSLSYSVGGLAPSPIRGPQGNIEFLLYLLKGPGRDVALDIPAVVDAAWKAGNEDA
jgi:23S rRNA (cytidine1920-2'-O)/16S rRNA (cytidine1409-2'-O)-methyltransferase